MALERKDLRLKLDPADHAGLQMLAEIDRLEMAEWAEAVLVAEVKRRIHDATVVAERATRLGISGSAGESAPVRAIK